MKFYDKNGKIHKDWFSTIIANVYTLFHGKREKYIYKPYCPDDDESIYEEIAKSTDDKKYRCACGSTYSDDPTVKCSICGTAADMLAEEVALYTDS